MAPALKVSDKMCPTGSYLGVTTILFCGLIAHVECFAPPISVLPTRPHQCQQPQSLPEELHSCFPRSSNISRRVQGRKYTSSSSSSLNMSAASATGAVSSFLSSLHANNSFVLSALLVVSACGIAMEQNTTIGKALSANLVTMLISLILANVGIMPFNSPVYKLTNKVLVPLAVPLFLFDSDLRRVVKDTGSLLIAFLVGALGTVVGTLAAFALVPLKTLGDQGWKVACALSSRHIGGAINFVAVADSLNIDGNVVSAAIAADNVVVALYFTFLFYLAVSGEGGQSTTETTTNDKDEVISMNTLGEEIAMPDEEKQIPITTSSIAYSMATSSVLVAIGSALTAVLCPNLSSIVITSILTVISATAFPGWFRNLRTSGTAIGMLFLQMFFSASGAGGSLLLVLRKAPSLIAFSALQLAIHFLVLMGVGRVLLRLDPNELYLASNANVGGPTTAAAMAQAKEWKKLVLPALLVGVLGYATATTLSLSMGPILIRLAAR